MAPTMNESSSEQTESMTFFSLILLRGCVEFAKSAQTECLGDRIIEKNTACVMFAAAYIEATLNEYLELFCVVDDSPEVPRDYWESVIRIQKKVQVPEKWDLIASIAGGKIWDSSCDPFQFFDDIIALRNELIHYKGRFLEVGKAPTNRLTRLVEKFQLQSQVVVGDGPKVSSWVIELLSNERLADWIAKQLSEFHQIRNELLLGKSGSQQ